MKKELYGILLFFLIVLTAVSLFTYHATDPSVENSFFTIPAHIHNSFGLLGAHIAGLSIFLFGMGAFWLPIILGFSSVWLLKERSAHIIWMTLLGGLFLMIGTGGILFLFKDAYLMLGTTISSGGIISITFTSFLLKYANITGCIILLVFFLLIGFILATGISVLSVGQFIRTKTAEIIIIMKSDFAEGIDFINEKYRIWQEQREERKKLIDITPIAQTNDHQTGKDLIKLPETSSEKKPTKASEPQIVFEPNIVELEEDDTVFKPDLDFSDIREKPEFNLPKLSFLKEKKKVQRSIDTELLKEKSRILESKLNDFNVFGEVVEILPGPVITTFEYKPAAGIKISKIAGLSDDLALALSAISIRIVAPIPGRDVVGIEIPNDERDIVNLRELIGSNEFLKSTSFLTLGLGKDLLGKPMVTSMDSMPHLLIAGATGTGKSVGLNSMIISLLYKGSPDDIKMIMIDPKRIELSVYNDIPHLISPVVTDMKKATNALFWAVREMERRYELLELSGLRNIVQYNNMVAIKNNEITIESEDENIDSLEKLPYIVVIVDELADLMMVASKDVEFALTRLAQMARAAGIHLIVATQRPSVDVLTGSIKANFPTRISFQVSSKVDARTIFDGGGSESLLGNGDMLFCPPGAGRLVRIQGAYISEDEISKVTAFLRSQRPPDYIEEVTIGDSEEGEKEFDESDYDEKYDEAVSLITKTRQASISFVQRRLRIGYNRAARLVEMMEHEGLVGPQVGSKPREVLVKSYDDD